MKRLQRKYKYNRKNNTLQITHNFVTDTNLSLSFKETTNYTKEKEIELLKEIKEEIIERIIATPNLLMENRKLISLLETEIITAGIGFSTGMPLGVLSGIVTSCLTFKDSEAFIKNTAKINTLKKKSLYIEKETQFLSLDISKLLKEVKQRNLRSKLKKEKEININNVDKFTKKELRKIFNI